MSRRGEQEQPRGTPEGRMEKGVECEGGHGVAKRIEEIMFKGAGNVPNEPILTI